jgi:small subunit ribosomal protein S4
MKIGPKYKIARRLGAPVFEKTQTAKYSQSLARKERSSKGRGRPKSEFGQSLIEKQKARYTYLLTERQFKNYVTKALGTANPIQKLFGILESRLDNVLFRSGLAKTRSAARQMASHGHTMVNGRRVTIPSILLSSGDVVSIRGGSSGSALFADVEERMKTLTAPVWLKVNPEKKEAEVIGEPVYATGEHVFDLGVVIEFYNR